MGNRGIEGAEGEAFGSGQLQGCLGSKEVLPLCAGWGAFGSPGLPRKGGRREGEVLWRPGGWRGAGRIFSLFLVSVLLQGTHCRVRTARSTDRGHLLRATSSRRDKVSQRSDPRLDGDTVTVAWLTLTLIFAGG